MWKLTTLVMLFAVEMLPSFRHRKVQYLASALKTITKSDSRRVRNDGRREFNLLQG